MRKATTVLILVIVITSFLSISAQSNQDFRIFRKVKILKQKGTKFYQQPVIVTFAESELIIEAKSKTSKQLFKYTDIRSAEYSYSKSPRWKTGLGMGAASLVFPPLLLIAIPVGFTKHRRHWLTIRTDTDFAVLKLSKRNRKIFIPTFETKTGVIIKGIGEEK